MRIRFCLWMCFCFISKGESVEHATSQFAIAWILLCDCFEHANRHHHHSSQLGARSSVSLFILMLFSKNFEFFFLDFNGKLCCIFCTAKKTINRFTLYLVGIGIGQWHTKSIAFLFVCLLQFHLQAYNARSGDHPFVCYSFERVYAQHVICIAIDAMRCRQNRTRGKRTKKK